MKKAIYLLISGLLFAPVLTFAETKVFTDTDLKKYEYRTEEIMRRDNQEPREDGKGGPEKATSEEKTETENSFREQMDTCNREIKSTIDLFNARRDSYSEAMKAKSVRKNPVLLDAYEKELSDLNKRIDSLREKRRELKIRVLAKYRSLPSWWEEPDIK